MINENSIKKIIEKINLKLDSKVKLRFEELKLLNKKYTASNKPPLKRQY